MKPLELAKVICGSYVKGCEEVGTEDNIILSVPALASYLKQCKLAIYTSYSG